jgi:hypothetical protein
MSVFFQLEIDCFRSIRHERASQSVSLSIVGLYPTPNIAIHYQFCLIFHGDFIPLDGEA